jgi:hypothetical protein
MMERDCELCTPLVAVRKKMIAIVVATTGIAISAKQRT